MKMPNRLSKQRFEIVLKMVKDIKPRQILDIGGVNETSLFFKDLYPNAEIWQLNIQENPRLNGFHHIVGDALNIPFKDNSFDLMFAGELIEHLIDPVRFVNEAKRVGMSGSHFILTTPNLAAWHNRLLLLFGYPPANYTAVPNMRVGMPRFPKFKDFGMQDHVRVFTIKGLLEFLKIHNFEIINWTTINSPDYKRRWGFVRRQILNIILPKGMKEDILVHSKIIK